MAFNLLVDLQSQSNDWRKLNEELMPLSKEFVEFFPIPATSNMQSDYLGISILNSKFSQTQIDHLESIITYLIKNEFTVFELYSSIKFSTDNVNLLGEKFLKQ